jgi:hypothetical protein
VQGLREPCRTSTDRDEDPRHVQEEATPVEVSDVVPHTKKSVRTSSNPTAALRVQDGGVM